MECCPTAAWIEGIRQSCVVVCRNEVRKLVKSLKGVGQPVETKAEVERQPRNDVPVVKEVEAIIVLDPMFAREELELRSSRYRQGGSSHTNLWKMNYC